MVRYSTLRYGTVRYATLRYGTVQARYGTAPGWYRNGTGTVGYSMVRTVRYGMVWCDKVEYVWFAYTYAYFLPWS
jgi:hypothetical protein